MMTQLGYACINCAAFTSSATLRSWIQSARRMQLRLPVTGQMNILSHAGAEAHLDLGHARAGSLWRPECDSPRSEEGVQGRQPHIEEVWPPEITCMPSLAQLRARMEAARLTAVP